jgi:diamine N-acetyltransferase
VLGWWQRPPTSSNIQQHIHPTELLQQVENLMSPKSNIPNHDIPSLAPIWRTARVLIRDCQLQDIPHLAAIFNACNYMEKWDPTFHIVDEREIKQLVENSLAKTGEHRDFRLQCLEIGKDKKTIGYFHLQLYNPRLPKARTAFLSMFVVDPAFQRRQYAQEVVSGLSRQLQACGCEAIWLEVYLKNWPALRFWIKQGFDKIVEYDGEQQHSETAQATLTLEKTLS